MLTHKEIMEMSHEEFVENWNNNHIQDSALKLLGAREMTEEDKKHLEENE